MKIIILRDNNAVKSVISVPEDDVETVRARWHKFIEITEEYVKEQTKHYIEFCNKVSISNPLEETEKLDQYINKNMKTIIPEFQKFMKDSGADIQFMKWEEF